MASMSVDIIRGRRAMRRCAAFVLRETAGSHRFRKSDCLTERHRQPLARNRINGTRGFSHQGDVAELNGQRGGG